MDLPPNLRIVDSHLHLVAPHISYREDVAELISSSSKTLGTPHSEILEPEFRKAAQSHAESIEAVFVEVLPTADCAVDEAAWVLEMCREPASVVQALVASAPVTEGAAAVASWVQRVKERCGGALPPALRGVRMQFPDGAAGDAVITGADFRSGLEELAKHDLHFEFCLHADRLAAVVAATRACPGTSVVLNHCGLNDSGSDFEAWQANLAALAACPNAIACKLSAIEEWQPRESEPAPYVEHALSVFGAERCMYGGNWFVPVVFGLPYGQTLELLAAVLRRTGASDDEKRAVFGGTARRVYRLSA